MSKQQKKVKVYKVSVYDLIKNKMPLTSFAIAHLFYGVPFRMNKCEKDIEGNLIFYE